MQGGSAQTTSYNLATDKTYLLTVQQRATVLRTGSTAPVTLTGPQANIWSLASDSTIDIDTQLGRQTMGIWNAIIVGRLRSSHLSPTGWLNPATQTAGSANAIKLQQLATVSLASSQLAVYFHPFTATSNNITYELYILPPYLASYWDNFYKPEIIGEANSRLLTITPARYNIRQWLDNLDSFIPPDIQRNTIGFPNDPGLTGSLGDQVRTILQTFWDNLPADDSRRLYVPVFGWSISNDFTLENAIFYITKIVYQTMLDQRFAVLPSTPIDTAQLATQAQQIQQENVRKLANTATQINILKGQTPIQTIYVVPTETSFPKLKVRADQPKMAITFPRTSGTKVSTAEERRKLRDIKSCIMGNNQACKGGNVTQPAGFLDYAAPIGPMPAMTSRFPPGQQQPDILRVQEALREQGIYPFSVVQ